MDVTPQRGASEFSTPSHRSRNPIPKFPAFFDEENEVVIKTICIVGDKLKSDNCLVDAINSFKINVVFSGERAEDVQAFDTSSTAFVVQDFMGPNTPAAFETLQKQKATIFGPPAIKELAARGVCPTVNDRPLFSHAMQGLGICFSGSKKEDIKKCFPLIQNMGGSVLKEVTTTRVTHLVAYHCRGEKYRYASTFGVKILNGDWIKAAWNHRHEVGFRADSKEFVSQFKFKPFSGTKILFYGYSEDERAHMVSELVRNGGIECTQQGDSSCTHVVVDDASVLELPDGVAPNDRIPVVKSEWFWASIQMDACADEKLHILRPLPDAQKFFSPQNSFNQGLYSPSTPGRSQSGKKRKRRKEMLSQLAGADHMMMNKRRSSVSELGMLSVSGSFLDTPSPQGSKAALYSTASEAASMSGTNLRLPTSPPATPIKGIISEASSQASSIQQVLNSLDLRNMTARQQVFHELALTEANYTCILSTILNGIKKKLEDTNMIGGQLLNSTEIKIIFGNLPPIYEIHSKMLNEFYQALLNWNDSFSIGSVYLKYAEDILKAYPPYINYFEDSKKKLQELDRTNPRFHAFLKICESKQDCGRQSLVELMMRPVQRLPSVTLLLNDLLKHTKKEKEHPDILALDKALNKIKEVLHHINKDKQRTEGQYQIFNIFNNIENCPPDLISSHRSFISKIDVVELGGSDMLCGKGEELSLFLFSDILEISKKRSTAKVLGLRSPSTLSLRNATVSNGTGTLALGQTNPLAPGHHKPPLKHIEIINLTTIKRVIDVVVPDSVNGGSVFALVCRSNEELKEKMFVFQIVASDYHTDKDSIMKQLCRHIGNMMYKTDVDTLMIKIPAERLSLDPSDFNISTGFGNRAYRTLHRKVNHAFSFNRTPTSVRLKRAVSSIISPMNGPTSSSTPVSKQPRGATETTPSGGLRNLHLVSCTNLMNTLESPKSSRMDIPVDMEMMPPPMPPLHLSATPKKGMASLAVPISPAFSLGDSFSEEPGEPRTPSLIIRRPSFKMKAAAFLGVSKNK